jgi:hypothetical protein
MSHHPFDIRETAARAFPGYDRVQADRFLHWLDVNGYIIVEKDADHKGAEATLVPPQSTEDAVEHRVKQSTPG